mmetsp:Transcript_25918/g.51922  ORF Transcript_25918/g.51922 Transcript_25918/m.51922 type:complete len:82 (+) Transcript_25918:644-889(+)
MTPMLVLQKIICTIASYKPNILESVTLLVYLISITGNRPHTIPNYSNDEGTRRNFRCSSSSVLYCRIGHFDDANLWNCWKE